MKLFISFGCELTLYVRVRNVVNIVSASHDPVFNLTQTEKSTFYNTFGIMAVGLDVVEKTLEDLEKEITCAICQEHYTDPKTLPCLHCYCKQCILKLALRVGLSHSLVLNVARTLYSLREVWKRFSPTSDANDLGTSCRTSPTGGSRTSN